MKYLVAETERFFKVLTNFRFYFDTKLRVIELIFEIDRKRKILRIPLIKVEFGINEINYKGVGVEDEVKIEVTAPIVAAAAPPAPAAGAPAAGKKAPVKPAPAKPGAPKAATPKKTN